MKSVSNDFKNAINAGTRSLKARVHLDLTGNFVDEGATVTASSEVDSVSTPASHTINSYTEPLRKWASANFLQADGSFYPLPSDGSEETGWWGNVISDVNGDLPTSETLTVTFPPRKVKTFWWYADPLRNHHPVDFVVEYHNNSTDTWITVENVTGYNDVYWESNLNAITDQVVDKIRLNITKLSPAQSRACILEFDATVTETFTDDDILNVSILEELEGDTGTLPIGNISFNEVDLSINNIDGRFFTNNTASPYYGLLKPNRRIRPYLGVEIANNTFEYVPMGVFWSNDWNIPSDGIEAKTTGQDRLKFMSDTTFSTSEVYENKTLYDLAEIVLQDYGLISKEYDIDEKLKDYTVPYAWFSSMSHRAALRKISEAALSVVYFDRDGLLRIKSYINLSSGASVGSMTDQNQIFRTNNPQRNSQTVNTVEVEARPRKPGIQETIYEQTTNIKVSAGSTKRMTIFYTKSPSIDVQTPIISGNTNTTVESWTPYAWGGNLVLENNGGTDEQITFTIDGTPLNETGGIKTVVEDSTRVAEEGTIKPKTIRNDLIQNEELAESIANSILSVFSSANKDITSNIRGNPSLELGDIITFVDNQSFINGDYVLIRQNLTFDGGLNGEVTGRKV